MESTSNELTAGARSQVSDVDRASELERQLISLPDPPEDLPRPWRWSLWQAAFAVAYISSVFIVWEIGKLLDISHISFFAGAFAYTGLPYILLGIFMISMFNLRGYWSNYSARANRNLNQAIKRYKRPGAGEGLHEVLAEYWIEGSRYYLVWLVPGTGGSNARYLSGGAEPLLMTHNGEVLSDEGLFQKVLLMWGVGVGINPRSLPFYQAAVWGNRSLRRGLRSHLTRLPDLLEKNQVKFESLGLDGDLTLVLESYDAKYVYLENTIDVIAQKIAWSDAYGWQSLRVMRYSDVLPYHEAYIETAEARRRYVENQRLSEAEAAALRLHHAVLVSRPKRGRWTDKKRLVKALKVFATPLIAGDDPAFTYRDGEWHPSDQVMEAFRSRVAFTRQVDAEQSA